MTSDQALYELAVSMRARAHAPYSGFLVGAAILDGDGKVHTGCNVENAAYPQGACAEAVAIGNMVSGGGKAIAVIAVSGGAGDPVPCSPCGGCRQRIREFANGDTRIITLGSNGNLVSRTMDELLPDSFGPQDLAR